MPSDYYLWWNSQIYPWEWGERTLWEWGERTLWEWGERTLFSREFQDGLDPSLAYKRVPENLVSDAELDSNEAPGIGDS